MKIKVGDIHRGQTSEERTKGDDSPSSHVKGFPIGMFRSAEDYYALRSKLQVPMRTAPSLISRYQEDQESASILAKHEIYKTRIVENFRRRLL